MVKPVRHRQTKGAATDMFYLTPPRHISTLHETDMPQQSLYVRCRGQSGRHIDWTSYSRVNPQPEGPSHAKKACLLRIISRT
jgi:hypothetical protein